MKQIVVVKLGWVLVGTVAAETDTSFELQGAYVVRQWGTTKGLGELAEKGPLPATKLDKTGHVTIERHSVLFRIDCETASWNNY